MTKLKTLYFCQKNIFCSTNLLHAHLQYVSNISAKRWKDQMKVLRGVDFTKYTTKSTILLGAVVRKWLSWKPCQFVKIYFQHSLCTSSVYLCNISTKCWKDPMKTLRITKSHNSRNTDSWVPIFLSNVHCLMGKLSYKFEQNLTKAVEVIEQKPCLLPECRTCW